MVDVSCKSRKTSLRQSTSGMTRIFLALALLLIVTCRLPAPIVENPETPTPTPTPAEPSNRQLRPGTSWKGASSEMTATPRPSSNRIPPSQRMQQGATRFAGTWSGKIKFGATGDVQFTLTVNPEATLLKQQSLQFGEHTHPTTHTAQTLSWKSGPQNGIAWTLTPNTNGQTASVTLQLGHGSNNTAVFHRAQSNSVAAPAKSPTTNYPGTKLKRPPGH